MVYGFPLCIFLETIPKRIRIYISAWRRLTLLRIRVEVKKMCDEIKMIERFMDGKGYKVFGVQGEELIGDYAGFKKRPVNKWLHEKDFRPSVGIAEFMSTREWPWGWMIFMNKKDALFWHKHQRCLHNRTKSVIRKVEFKGGQKATAIVRYLGGRSNLAVAKQIKILPDT